MAALGPEIFTRGFRFNPSPLEAATYYLPRLVAGEPLQEAVRPVVHHADVYACEPGDLARQFHPVPKTGNRFFLSSCKKGVRAAGPGTWSMQSAAAIKDGADAKVGEIKKFRYKKRGVFTDWLMEEVSACCLEDENAVAGDAQFVLCKIYVSPRAGPDSPARQESAAIFAQPALAPGVAATQAAAAPKRPAPQDDEPPCPKPRAVPSPRPLRSRRRCSSRPVRPQTKRKQHLIRRRPRSALLRRRFQVSTSTSSSSRFKLPTSTSYSSLFNAATSTTTSFSWCPSKRSRLHNKFFF